MGKSRLEEENIHNIQKELVEEAISGGMMGGYEEEGFPFYYINDKMLEYLGYKNQDDFIADIDGCITNCMHPEDRDYVDAECEKQLDLYGSYQLEYRMRCQDGSYIWVHDIGKRFQTIDHRMAIMSLCYDITAEKKQADFLQNFVDSMNGSMGNYMVEADGRLEATYMSSNMGKMLGMDKEAYMKICEKDAMDCISPEDRELVTKSILETVRLKKATSVAFRALNGEGGYTWLNGSYTYSGMKDGLPMIQVVFTPASTQFELQQDIIHNVPGGVCLYRWDGGDIRPLMFSKQFRNIYGGDGTGTKQISFVNYEYVHPEDLEGYQKFVQRIIKQPGHERTYTFRFWNLKEERYFWVSVKTSDVLQKDGSILIYATYYDVDDIKSAQEELKQNERLLQAKIKMEQERLFGSEGNLLAYVVSNITKDQIIEHKTFQMEEPIAQVGISLLDGARKNIKSILDEEKKKQFIKNHEKLYLEQLYDNGQSSISMEYQRKNTKGIIIWEKMVMNILKSPETGNLFLYEYCYDINKEKVLEEISLAAIRYDYERYGSINLKEDQISILLPDFDTDGYGLRVAEYSALCEEYAKTHVYEEDREMFLQSVLREPLKQMLEKTGAFEFSHRELGEDGTIHHKLNRHAYYDREKEICLITRSDITETVRAEEEKKNQLQMALEKEQKAARVKSDFLSRMSHELRTPLNAITGYTTLLQETATKTQKEQLNAVENATKYLLAIIGDLLDTQKIESGKIQLKKERVNADVYMQNIVEMIRPEASLKQIDFTYDRLTKLSEYYYVDGVRLQQVLLNLLHNAIKFTPRGGKVLMTARALENIGRKTKLEFKVSDNGIGMSDDFMRHHLYQKFSQENNSMTSPYAGTGIGLAISKELIHLMDGEIQCDSKKDEGTTFTITIMAKTIEGTRKRRRPTGKINYDLGGIHVLVCEDNPMNQDMTKRLLTKMNCNVEVADDGKCGVQLYAEKPEKYFDLVLMDLRMPVMDGFEATRQIRSSKKEDAKTIPILALSANAFEEDVKASLECGMNEHLAKPIDAKILYEKMKQYCQ